MKTALPHALGRVQAMERCRAALRRSRAVAPIALLIGRKLAAPLAA